MGAAVAGNPEVSKTSRFMILGVAAAVTLAACGESESTATVSSPDQVASADSSAPGATSPVTTGLPDNPTTSGPAADPASATSTAPLSTESSSDAPTSTLVDIASLPVVPFEFGDYRVADVAADDALNGRAEPDPGAEIYLTFEPDEVVAIRDSGVRLGGCLGAVSA